MAGRNQFLKSSLYCPRLQLVTISNGHEIFKRFNDGDRRHPLQIPISKSNSRLLLRNILRSHCDPAVCHVLWEIAQNNSVMKCADTCSPLFSHHTRPGIRWTKWKKKYLRDNKLVSTLKGFVWGTIHNLIPCRDKLSILPICLPRPPNTKSSPLSLR